MCFFFFAGWEGDRERLFRTRDKVPNSPMPGTRAPGSSSSSSKYFSLDMCSAAHKADKNKVLTECLNANFSN